ncbi:GAF domain-containing protein [Arthrobacter sp. 49Tsu3.1M3]|uniref:GAF and ANTAR domain-containing protein n=1 Tax=Arthrobacter sp. 49Tsu3.1M3 TaxID=1279029 RepID=UPI0009A74B86|nr:GAF and ANTAR domain-containing protein [Arthrobacter sp. 49Tsu3.1M3]SKC10102.1 GAF domain-containing protein [Arthrobacter sp. 49Tsu3.1M3]
MNSTPGPPGGGTLGVTAEDAGRLAYDLQDLVLDSPDVEEFLTELATMAAMQLSTAAGGVLCGVTTIRRKHPAAAASSDPRARAMDELQNGFGDGPCLTALRDNRTLYVPDLAAETRWGDYISAVAAQGIGSILAVPLDLAGEASAVLNLYSTRTDGFSDADIAKAESFASHATGSLRLALRIAHLREVHDNLSAAMDSRTTIDMAIGAVMAQNRCSRDAAFRILANASNHRNVKLRDVAASIIASISGETDIQTRFEE